MNNMWSYLLASVCLICPSVSVAQFNVYNTGNSNLVSDLCYRIAVDSMGNPWVGHPFDGTSTLFVITGSISSLLIQRYGIPSRDYPITPFMGCTVRGIISGSLPG
ncbi:MAG: hypothetical protein ABIJ04_05805 [Bacteroidota bacterium]